MNYLLLLIIPIITQIINTLSFVQSTGILLKGITFKIFMKKAYYDMFFKFQEQLGINSTNLDRFWMYFSLNQFMIRNYFLESLGQKIACFFPGNKPNIQQLMDLIFLPNEICKIFN